jgi:SAM-dependent methyltransferase
VRRPPPRDDPPGKGAGRPVRRALTHVGGPATARGDAEAAAALAHALDVPSSVEAEALARDHVHGFHSYPARLHPQTAARLVEAWSRPGERVLDPFCGSGTVLVEARRLGRHALGSDLNPLAVRLAELKSRTVGADERARLCAAAEAVARVSDERRKARAGPSRRYGPDDLEAFDRHVLLALDGLRVGVEATREPELRLVLELVLSSLLTKLSRRAGDSASAVGEARSLSQRLPARLFVSRTAELARALERSAELFGEAPPAQVALADARSLSWVDDASVELVVTSPPYPGVYDYVAHHASRLRWLGLDARPLEHGELVPRRRPSRAASIVEAYVDVLAEVRRALVSRGRAVVVVGDGTSHGGPVPMDRVLDEAARHAGLRVLAIASQERPHFHGGTAAWFARTPRREHAVLLGHVEKYGSEVPTPRRSGRVAGG